MTPRIETNGLRINILVPRALPRRRSSATPRPHLAR